MIVYMNNKKSASKDTQRRTVHSARNTPGILFCIIYCICNEAFLGIFCICIVQVIKHANLPEIKPKCIYNKVKTTKSKRYNCSPDPSLLDLGVVMKYHSFMVHHATPQTGQKIEIFAL